VKGLIPNAAIKNCVAFTAIAILLIAAEPRAFRQDDHGTNEPQSSGVANQPEELFQEALIRSDTQDFATARIRLQQAMGLWVQLRDPGKAAEAALQMGDHSNQAGEYYEALYYYNQALDVRSLPSTFKPNAFNAIAKVYAELFRDDLATHYFSEALLQARLIKYLPAQTLALTGLANLYRQRGDKTKALACISRAQRLNDQKNVETEAALLYLFGEIKQEEGSVTEAKRALEDALAIYEKCRDTAGKIRVLCNLSTLSLQALHKRVALNEAEQAVELAEKEAKRALNDADDLNARELRWPAWLSRARAERALGQKERALKSYFWAVNHFEGVWWGRAVFKGAEASAIGLREESQAAYREYADLLIEQGQFKRAYELADKARARTILNRITARRSASRSQGDQEASMQEASSSIARLRLQLLDPRISAQQKTKLQKAIDNEEYKLEEARLRNDMAHSRERMVWSQLISAEQLQKKTAQDGNALVEFLLGENRSFIWLFNHGEVFYATLPPRRDIDKAVRSYLDLLATPPDPLLIEQDLAKVKAQGEMLFSMLFGPLAKQIDPLERLIVVPDGLLNYLPFEGLILNGQYLIENHEISYVPSASMLNLWQESSNRAPSSDQMELFAVGDPDFGPQTKVADTRVSAKGLRSQTSRATPARSFQLPSLPRTRDEVQFIANLFPADRSKVLLGSAATETAIKHESLNHYRRLHFATHSIVDDKTPWRSAVLLTADEEEDGYLEVDEISELDLECELVVLSACQTGQGQLLSGEGIVGLSRAFLRAGAQSVVVSLWSVSDISTGQLMKSFYQHLAGNVGNASALRSAKLQMLESNTDSRHPYYWASFISVGKP